MRCCIRPCGKLRPARKILGINSPRAELRLGGNAEAQARPPLAELFLGGCSLARAPPAGLHVADLWSRFPTLARRRSPPIAAWGFARIFTARFAQYMLKRSLSHFQSWPADRKLRNPVHRKKCWRDHRMTMLRRNLNHNNHNAIILRRGRWG